MAINSRDKGARGERDLAAWLKERGYTSARRGQQFSGGGDSPDVVCEELDWMHIEVKFTERFNAYPALAQATEDSKGTEKYPVVFHRRNKKNWIVVMDAAEFFDLIEDDEGQ